MSDQPSFGAMKNAAGPILREAKVEHEEEGPSATAACSPSVIASNKAPAAKKVGKKSAGALDGEERKENEEEQAAAAAAGAEKAAEGWEALDLGFPTVIEKLERNGDEDPHHHSHSSLAASRRQELAARMTELMARGKPVDAELLHEYNEALGGGRPSPDTISIPPLGLVLQERVGPEPGAFRVVPGQSVVRASALRSSVTSWEGNDRNGGNAAADRGTNPAVLGAGGGAQGHRATGDYLVEANLVTEEDLNGPAPLLVEAKPIRRRRQLAFTALVAVAVLCIIVGLSVGLTANRPSLPATPSPTPAPTSRLDQLFRPTLPPYTLDSLQNTSSPQYRAYEWATEVDQVPWEEAPLDEPLRLARMKQRFALATLFFATGGADGAWRNGTGWLNSTAHECSWSLCFCYGNYGSSDVQWLELTSNDLAGPLPREIGILSSLMWLHVDKNLLSGSLPSELGALTLLQALLADGNIFTGNIPSDIGRLTNLTYASLTSNGFVGTIPTEIGRLTNLAYLDLSDNLLRHSIPKEIGSLSHLTTLKAARNALSEPLPTTLAMLTRLVTLDLAENFLEGPFPTELGRLTTLLTLDLSVNRLTSSIPTELDQMSSLWALLLSSNALTGSIPTELGGMSSVFGLDISGNQLSSSIPTELALLTGLRVFSLRLNALTGRIPTDLGRLSALLAASFAGNALTGPIPTELGLLTQVTGLLLGQNRLTGSVPAELCQLKDFRPVSISVDCLENTCDCGCICAEDIDDNYWAN
jgi:Leucine-rich repeat (LRR) protein